MTNLLLDDSAELGREIRGLSLLFVISGVYAIFILGFELSAGAVILGALIGVGMTVADAKIFHHLDRETRITATVAITAAFFVATVMLLEIAPQGIVEQLGSVTLGMGVAGLVAGLTMWARGRDPRPVS